MYKVGDLAKAFDLSRSTLLYYDKIGLLEPSGRSVSNYRLYTQGEHDRLKKISVYKAAGLSLQEIALILDVSTSGAAKLLEMRLANLNAEISGLREQQALIVSLLGEDALLRSTKLMNKTQWVKILRSSGLDEEGLYQWHIEFERDLPQVHSDFLESLGIDPEEIQQIKGWSKQRLKENHGELG